MKAAIDILIADKSVLKFEEAVCDKHGPYQRSLLLIEGRGWQAGKCPQCLAEELEAERQAAIRKDEEYRVQFAQKRIENAMQRAMIPSDFKQKTFDNYKPKNAAQDKALRLAKGFVSKWDLARSDGLGLLFFGACGVGKSHLACAILQELIPQGVTGLYMRVADLVRFVRSSWGKDAEMSETEAIRQVVDMDLLVIDELGVQAGSANEQQIIFAVIDARLSENRPTIFLTNKSPGSLAPVLGERTVDRIKGKCVLHMIEGESMRRPLSANVFLE